MYGRLVKQLLAVVSVFVCACSSGPGPTSTPEAMIEGLLASAEKEDLEGMLKALPPKLLEEVGDRARSRQPLWEELKSGLKQGKQAVADKTVTVERRPAKGDAADYGTEEVKISWSCEDLNDCELELVFKDGKYYLVDVDIGDPKGEKAATIKEFEALRDRVCACQDKTCAEAVSKDFDAFIKANQNAPTTNDDDQRELAKISESYVKCMMNAMTQ